MTGSRFKGAGTDPIAIVGIGCRFPGGATDTESFWRLLVDEVDTVSEVPASRFSLDAIYDPRPQTPGRISSRFGAFLDDIEFFDAEFFGMTPLEAKNVDPQQRLLLEVAWEAVEDAGMVLDRMPRQRSGVYVGMMASEYEDRMQSNLETLNGFALNGGGRYGASGRLSFALGLHGPSLTIDTACSSSLLAVHLACQSLRHRECDLAFAGGSHVILQPHVSVSLSQANILARDGRCKFGDARADGFVRGEGAGIVLLKRLDEAVSDGDRIHAIVRGSAVNNDGNSSRTMGRPNRKMQAAMLHEAYRAAGVAPSDVAYVEAHGTGTAAGDPVELLALGEVLGASRPAYRPLRVGSVKTNIGHTEGASGIAGLIKLSLCLQHGLLPRSLHFEQASPAVEWDAANLMVQKTLTPWPSDTIRRGGVNSFGMSGTNVHVVLEQATHTSAPAAEASAPERPLHVLPLSAKSDAALYELAERYADHLEAHPDLSIEDLCHTAGVGRAHFDKRIALVVPSRQSAMQQLRSIASPTSSPGRTRARIAATGKHRVAFLFTGQGSQYLGMGRELYETQPVFRDAIDHCAQLLASSLPTHLVSLLYESQDDARLRQTEYTQPALFAVEFALAALWRSWGVLPDAVMGHSVGEYAAACVAGVMSLEDGLRLLAERGRRIQALPPGAMISVPAPEERVAQAIAEAGNRVCIAAVNGPEQVTVSGDANAIEALSALLDQGGIRVKRLEVSHAFHSAAMVPMLDDFEKLVSQIALRPPTVPLATNVTGAMAGDEIATSAYWRRQIREPVRFSDGVRALHEHGIDTFLEIGPHPTLITLALSCLPDRKCTWLSSLRRGRQDWEVLSNSLAHLYEQGVPVDWTGFDRPYPRHRVPAPTYPWQRQKHWIEPTRYGKQASKGHASSDVSVDGAPRFVSGTMRVAPADSTVDVTADDGASDRLQPVRDLLRLGPDTTEDATLESLGVDSLGIVIIRSALVDVPGGKELARRLNAGSLASEVLALIDSAGPMPSRALGIDDYLGKAAWIDVTPASVNKRSPDHVLLMRGSSLADAGGAEVMAELRMNTNHPFFYERPLDHVPGLYLVEAVRQLFNWRVYAQKGRIDSGGSLDRLEADFFEFVEHDSPAYIVLSSAGETYTADLFQENKRKATFVIAARRIEAEAYGRLRDMQRKQSGR